MTKEDLLREHDKYAWECDESEHVVPYSKAEKSMDEWAKYISQTFDSWKWDNRWHSFENGYWYQTLEHPSTMSDKTYNKYHRKTPQELYNQFIEQQNKDNDK